MINIDNKNFSEWHGIDRKKIEWFPSVDEDKCIGCGLCVTTCGRGVSIRLFDNAEREGFLFNECFYLLWYNLFFVAPLMILTLVFYFGWMKVEKAEETRLKLRKYMRLVAGLMMLALGLAMFFRVI